jgi:predicted tellurium resistance membrane protein TerC
MTENAELWLTPLLLAPGLALLVMSTSHWFAQVHNEIHNLKNHMHGGDKKLLADNLLRRSEIFRDSLVCLYTSIAFLSIGSLIGGVAILWKGDIFYYIIFMSCFGVIFLILAVTLLIRKSLLTMKVIREHHDEIEKD